MTRRRVFLSAVDGQAVRVAVWKEAGSLLQRGTRSRGQDASKPPLGLIGTRAGPAYLGRSDWMRSQGVPLCRNYLRGLVKARERLESGRAHVAFAFRQSNVPPRIVPPIRLEFAQAANWFYWFSYDPPLLSSSSRCPENSFSATVGPCLVTRSDRPS